MEKLKFNPKNAKYYSEEFIKGFECGVDRQYNADMAEKTTIIRGVLANIKDEIRNYEAECKSDNAECNQCNDVTFKSIIAIIESEGKKYD